jgi:hypothetical protein
LSAFIGIEAGGIQIHNIEDFPRLVDQVNQRPKQQWWLNLQPITKILAQPAPRSQADADQHSESFQGSTFERSPSLDQV